MRCRKPPEKCNPTMSLHPNCTRLFGRRWLCQLYSANLLYPKVTINEHLSAFHTFAVFILCHRYQRGRLVCIQLYHTHTHTDIQHTSIPAEMQYNILNIWLPPEQTKHDIYKSQSSKAIPAVINNCLLFLFLLQSMSFTNNDCKVA